jgi:hypothetical protein
MPIKPISHLFINFFPAYHKNTDMSLHLMRMKLLLRMILQKINDV